MRMDPTRIYRVAYGAALTTVLAFIGMVCWAQDGIVSPDDAFLDGLRGTWVMDGTLGDKPVRYMAEGRRVLQRSFIELHMVDVGPSPGYEATVFIGYDPKSRDYVGHWLDRFGAAGARVVALGARTGDTLVLNFPYAEGAFRDTLTWLRPSRSWSLLLESQKADGKWATFAHYTLAPRKKRP